MTGKSEQKKYLKHSLCARKNNSSNCYWEIPDNVEVIVVRLEIVASEFKLKSGYSVYLPPQNMYEPT